MSERRFTKTTYGETLVEMGRKDPNIVVLEADLMKASGSELFMNAFPERHFNVGIAEQNLLAVAAGMAAVGLTPFASSFSCFVSQRACDQAMNAIAYNAFNVKIVGSYAGLSTEKNGGTHMSVADVAIFRAIPRFTILAPADCVEFKEMLRFAGQYIGPVYIRVPRGPLSDLFSERYAYEHGKARLMSDGSDATLITTGLLTNEGIGACILLAQQSIRVRHLHIPCIKPLDQEAIVQAAKDTGVLFVAEDHSVLGGLGSGVTEVVTSNYPVKVHRFGMEDCFGMTANLAWLLDHFRLSANHLAERMKSAL